MSDLWLQGAEDHDSPGPCGESPPEGCSQGGEVQQQEDQGAEGGGGQALPHQKAKGGGAR